MVSCQGWGSNSWIDDQEQAICWSRNWQFLRSHSQLYILYACIVYTFFKTQVFKGQWFDLRISRHFRGFPSSGSVRNVRIWEWCSPRREQDTAKASGALTVMFSTKWWIVTGNIISLSSRSVGGFKCQLKQMFDDFCPIAKSYAQEGLNITIWNLANEMTEWLRFHTV